MTPINFLTLALATFWITYALVHLDLPFGVMKAFRERITTFGGLLLCYYCASWWTALALYGVQYRAIDVVMASAIAGAACLAYRYTGGHYS